MKGIYEWLLTKFLKSSKFWLAIAGVVATFLSEKLGLDHDELMAILASIVALIVGKGIQDAGKEAAKTKTSQN